jgi:membrane protein
MPASGKTAQKLAQCFGAIYKVLPDKPIAWRDVAVGAIATAFLFTVGKTLIGLYMGHSNIRFQL